MLELIKSEIVNLKVTLENTPGAATNGYREEHLFGGVCVKYFYHPESSFNLADWEESFCDGARDNGIDWISRNAIEDDAGLYLIQSKFQGSAPTANEVVDMIRKMEQGFQRLEANSELISQKAKDAFNSQLGYVTGEWEPKYVVFLATDLSPDKRADISDALGDDFNWEVHGLSEIDACILARRDGNAFVPEGKLKIWRDHGAIELDEYGLIVNVRASSLQKCYNEFKGKGLFAQNFREFVAKKSVDDGVKKSLINEPHLFWERNNGLIITCSEKQLDGDVLKLWDFSIVNGCQTTSLIGRSQQIQADDDFPLVCKVISASDDVDRVEKIAEASNSQKAIKMQDLKANAPEQKRLHQEFLAMSPRIDLMIKRGVKEAGVDSRITNKVLGQLILSCVYQEPGRARSNTSSLFENAEVYKKTFRRRGYSVRSYFGLIQLNQEYDLWLKQVGTDWASEFAHIGDPEKLALLGAVVKNGKWVLLAATAAMVKVRSMGLNERELMDGLRDSWSLPSPLLNDDRPDDWVNVIRVFWRSLAEEVFVQYESALRNGNTNSVSNFTKGDETYRRQILNELLKMTLFSPSPRRREDADEVIDAVFNVVSS